MRILVLTDRYPPFYEGGYELDCHQVTQGLRARGHTLIVLTTTFGVRARTADGDILRLLSFHDHHHRGGLHRRGMQLRVFLQGQRNYWISRRLADEIRPDLAFVWLMLGASILPVLAVQDIGIRTVFRVGAHC